MRTLDYLCTEAAFDDSPGVTLEHLEQRFVAVAPELDVKSVTADAKIEQRQVGQPLRQQRVDIQFSAWCVRYDPEHRVHEGKNRTGSPSLGHIRPKILYRKAIFVAL